MTVKSREAVNVSASSGNIRCRIRTTLPSGTSTTVDSFLHHVKKFGWAGAFSVSFRFGALLPNHSVTRRKRRALAITETELKVIAALAIIGLNRSPKNGYKAPAAIGTPSTL
jgi:hypothetical protein